VTAATATATTAAVVTVVTVVTVVPMVAAAAGHGRAEDGARDKVVHAAGGPVCLRRLHEHGLWRRLRREVSAHAHALHPHWLLGDSLRGGPLGHWLSH